MGLRVTIEIFSGRSNPSWTVRDQDDVRMLLPLLLRNRAGIAEPCSGFCGLGFRGIRVESADDVGLPGLPRVFEVAGGGAQDPFASAELAERLLETMPSGSMEAEGQDAHYPDALRESVHTAIEDTVRRAVDGTVTFKPPEQPPDDELAAEVHEQMRELSRRTVNCEWDSALYQPGFWSDYSVLFTNNCYNYAINTVTNTFARPGRAHGFEIPLTVTNSDVSFGAQKDGVHLRGHCQPQGVRRYWLAMVTGYSPAGFRDFHWFRYHHEGFWSHKPGGYPVRNIDNSGATISNPQQSDNGGYTEWGGIFLSHDSVVIN